MGCPSHLLHDATLVVGRVDHPVWQVHRITACLQTHVALLDGFRVEDNLSS